MIYKTLKAIATLYSMRLEPKPRMAGKVIKQPKKPAPLGAPGWSDPASHTTLPLTWASSLPARSDSRPVGSSRVIQARIDLAIPCVRGMS